MTKFIYDLMIFMCVVFGLFSGIYVAQKTLSSKLDRISKMLLLTMAVIQFCTGLVYLFAAIGIIAASPASQLSGFMRPINLLYVSIPTAIVRRMGLL